MKIRGRFCEEQLALKSRFARESFRWKKSGKVWILIGCPKNKFKHGRCTVGTRAYKILRSRRGLSCPSGTKSITK